MLDAKIAYLVNKIIQNHHFKKEGQSRGAENPKGGSSLTRKTDSLHDLRLFSSDWRSYTVLDYADFISVTLHDDNVQEFDTKWCEVLLSMSKIPSDDILESLYKLRIRESAQFKAVLELYDMEIHQKISMPNYQKLKTVVTRSTDQKLRFRNFEVQFKLTSSVSTIGRASTSGFGQVVCVAKRTTEIAGFLLLHSTHSRLLNRLCLCGVKKSFPTPPSNLSMSCSGCERRCEDVILQGMVVPQDWPGFITLCVLSSARERQTCGCLNLTWCFSTMSCRQCFLFQHPTVHAARDPQTAHAECHPGPEQDRLRGAPPATCDR